MEIPFSKVKTILADIYDIGDETEKDVWRALRIPGARLSAVQNGYLQAVMVKIFQPQGKHLPDTHPRFKQKVEQKVITKVCTFPQKCHRFFLLDPPDFPLGYRHLQDAASGRLVFSYPIEETLIVPLWMLHKVHHKMRLRRQLGENLHADKETIAPNMKTKQEVPLKTRSSYRYLDIPDYVYCALLEERKKYEKNRSRRQHGKWVFQDLNYVCCSSYGRPRSRSYHYKHYVKLIKEAGVPHITFHDLRHTYTTILMKNDINQRAIANALGHSKSIITVDTYTDMKMIIEDCVEEMQEFISEVHPYDATDKEMLENMFQEKLVLKEQQRKMNCIHYIPGIIIYDYSDVDEMEDIAEWHMGKGAA